MSADERAPATGERHAALGLDAQYRVAAALIYDQLLDGRLEWIAVADPKAGRVDDMQIATPGQVDAYQVKWGRYPPALTYGGLKGDGSGGGMIAQLADGWARLREVNPGRTVRVHLITNSAASTADLDAARAVGRRGVPHHMAAFLDQAWARSESPDDASPDFARWLPCLKELQASSGIVDDVDFESFRLNCLIQTGWRLPPAGPLDTQGVTSQRDRDLEALATLLFAVVSREPQTIRLTRLELLARLEWVDRFEFKAKHDFPVTPAYQPIEETVQELETAIDQLRHGYVALLGTPGSGKSTLLSATLRYREGFRVIPYYCYVPDEGGLSRGEAVSFLHDLTLALWREEIRPSALAPSLDLDRCRALFEAQLRDLHNDFEVSKRRTLILIDGLDHVEREQSPQRSLVAELPPPDSVPEGVLIVLGSQKLELDRLNPRIASQLNEKARTVRMRPLSRRAMHAVVEASGLASLLGPPDIERIESRCAGHPLALAYIINRIRPASTNAEASAAIEATPVCGGAIEQEYQIYWSQHLDAEGVRDLLALASRLRVPLDLSAAEGWAGEAAVRALFKSAHQYFATDPDGHWRFFHNSFKQFVLDRTGRSPFRDAADPQRDQRYHQRLADLAQVAPPASTFAWELVFHQYQAGNFDQVAESSTQPWFRSQFLLGRAPELIREDIGLALRAARDRRDPMTLVRLLLIDEEISERAEVLGSLDLPAVLLALRNPDKALSAALHVQGIHLKGDRARGLRLASEFLQAGFSSHARRAFDAAEPLDVLSGGREFDLRDNTEREAIDAWVKVAHHFLPVANVVAIINRLQMQTWAGRDTADAEDERERERVRLLSGLGHAAVASGSGRTCAELLQAVREREPTLLPELEEEMNEAWVASWPGHPAGSIALDRLLAEQDSGQSPIERALLVAERVLRYRRDPETARRIVEGLPRPVTLAWRGEVSKSLAPLWGMVRLYRLLAALGRPVKPEVVAPTSDDPERNPDVLLERMLVRVANVWGAAWHHGAEDAATVWSELLPAVRIQEISRAEKRRPPLSWYSYQSVADEYYGVVVRAAAAHGSGGLTRFGEEIEARWASPATADLWPAHLRRQIALRLWRAGDDPGRIRRTLVSIEPLIGCEGDVHERVSSIECQIKAWAEIGDLEHACFLVPQLFEGSFDIFHDKDAQLEQWVHWFGRALESGDEQAMSDEDAFMSGVASAAAARHGSASRETAEAAITTIARFDCPAAASLYRRAFLDRAALDFEGGVAALCAAAASAKTAVSATCSVVAHLVLPYTEAVRAELARDLGQAIGDLGDAARAPMLLASLEDAIDIDAAPLLRGGWKRALLEGLRHSRDPRLAERLRQIDESTGEPPLDVHDEQSGVTLRDGSRLTGAQVMERGKDKDGLINLLHSVSENRYHHWLSLLKPLAPSLEVEDVSRLLSGLKGIGASMRCQKVLWERLLKLGRLDLLEAEAKGALDSSQPRGWYRVIDGGSRIVPLKVLTTIDDGYRARALETFIDDYLGAARYPREAARMLDELADLFWARPPAQGIWREVREHVFQLGDFGGGSDPIVVPQDARVERGALDWERALVGVLFEALALPMPELRQDAYCGVMALAGEGLCAKPIADEMEELFRSGREGRLLGLSLLDGVPAVTLTLSPKISREIAAAASDVDAPTRELATRLSRNSGVEPPRPSYSNALSAIYELSLPPYATEDRICTAAVLEPGSALPDTGDPLENVGLVLPILRVFSGESGVPLRNVVERANVLMRSYSADEPWDSGAEEELMESSNRLGLETPYRRPRAAAALRAAATMLGELIAAGKLPEALAHALVPTLALRDPILADAFPGRRPPGRQLVLVELEMTAGRHLGAEEWVAGIEESTSLDWPHPRVEDGGEVLAFAYQADRPDWSRYEEERRGNCVIAEPSFASGEELFKQVLPYDFFWQAARYLQIGTEGREAAKALAIQGFPAGVEIGRAQWVALNPQLGITCGWKLAARGLFRWVNGTGRTMVESQWWRDGRVGRHPRHDDTRSEGWLVWASPEGAAELLLRHGGWPRVQVAMRSAVTHDKRRLEAYCSAPPKRLMSG